MVQAMRKTVDQIIEACGGADRVAQAIGQPRDRLRTWRYRGAIPARHQLTLIRLSGGNVTVDDFVADEAAA